MNSVTSALKVGQRLSAYGIPIGLWHYDWPLRPFLVETVSDDVYMAIVWPTFWSGR